MSGPNTASETYAINDLGQAGFLDFSTPVAFNDTGQIIGYDTGIDAKGDQQTEVTVYNSTNFVKSTGTFFAVEYEGIPIALSARTPRGLVSFVGVAQTPTQDHPVPFFGHGWGSTYSTVTYTGYDGAVLGGVNSAGEAAGAALYLLGYRSYPARTGPTFGPALGYTDIIQAAPGVPLVVANPACTGGDHLCPLSYWAGEACPFGGCTINANGTIVAADAGTSDLMTFVYGKPETAVDLPLSAYDISSIFLNDAGQIAFTTAVSQVTTTYVYSIGTGTMTQIPLPAKSSCTGNVVESFNNRGRVLGYTSGCSIASDEIYFTWDPVNGELNVNDELPASPYYQLSLIGINDNGQLLADGDNDYVILNPPNFLSEHRPIRR